jgi:hypothetical protein
VLGVADAEKLFEAVGDIENDTVTEVVVEIEGVLEGAVVLGVADAEKLFEAVGDIENDAVTEVVVEIEGVLEGEVDGAGVALGMP